MGTLRVLRSPASLHSLVCKPYFCIRRLQPLQKGNPLDIEPERLSRLLQDVYAAALEPADRAVLANRLAAAFDSRSCLLQTRDRNPQDITIVGATNNCTEILPDYVAYYHAQDFWTVRGTRHMGCALLGEDIVPVDELTRTELYCDVLTSHEIHHIVGSVFEIEPNAIAAIGIHRPADAASFDASDRTTMALLLPHLRQSLRLIRTADVDRRARRLSFEALAKLSVAVFVVSGDARIRMMNSAAEALAKKGADVVVRHGRLALLQSACDEQLRLAIRAASLAPIGRSLSAGGTIVVPRGSGPSLSLMVSPLPAETAGFGPPEPLAAVFAGEPSRVQPGSRQTSEMISAVYGLTAAEARVLFALLEGRRLADYAADAGISLNTANTQLKSAFGKTGCHRQIDLVRMVMNDPLLRLSEL